MKPVTVMYKNFPESGYTIFRTPEILFTFDHGPLGMAPLFNHGHADALSITLSVNGDLMIVDPGTYAYNGVSEFRKYFKGTRAHNTVTIDKEDQAMQETGFIWRYPYTACLSGFSRLDEGLIIEGTHNGYERLKDPVTHIRKIFFSGGDFFLIKDSFRGNGLHDFELNYHLHPHSMTTEQADGWWLVTHKNTRVYLRLLDGSGFNYREGNDNPLLGWYSPSYGVRVKSGVLSHNKRGHSNDVLFVTAMCLNTPMHVKELSGKMSLL